MKFEWNPWERYRDILGWRFYGPVILLSPGEVGAGGGGKGGGFGAKQGEI